MTELSQAKRVRASILGLLTKQRNNLNTVHDSISVSGLNVMAGLVDDYYKRFTVISEKINLLATGDEEEEENATAKDEEFAESYVSLKTEILELLDERTPKVDPLNASLNASTSHQRSVKLPKLELPKFSGHYHKWMDFKNEFVSMILNDTSLNDIDRFRFLKSALTDAPRMIISNMEISEANFQTAWKALCDRYDNRSLIFRSHINQILSLQGASGASSESCRTLLDKAQAHYRSLAALGSAEQILDNFLITIIMSKLDGAAQSKWEETATNEIATWENFSGFLERYSASLERLGQSRNQPVVAEKPKNSGKKTHTNTVLTSSNKNVCPKCRKNDHAIIKCPDFIALTPRERFDAARSLNLCIACLVSEHSSRSCKSRCKTCSNRHHELLHFGKEQQNPQSHSNSGGGPTSLLAAQIAREFDVLLASVTIFVHDSTGNLIPCNALLDSGSTDHYVSEHFARLINAPRTRVSTLSGGIGSCVVQSKGKCTLTFTSRFGTSSDYQINPTILQKVTDCFPARPFGVENWDIPPHIQLADPNFNTPKDIDLLIGSGLFWQLLTMERIELGPDLPLLFGTDVGWIVVGPYVPSGSSFQTSLIARMNSNDDEIESFPYLDELVSKFWEIDSFNAKSVIPLKPSDQFCEDNFARTTFRDFSGRYHVRLPFKSDPSQLGKSLEIATKRFLNLERKLDRQPEVKRQYSDFIREYRELNHLEVVEHFDFEQPHYVLPHHCVLKPSSSSTKLRVVFDASCKTSNGVSLNDILHPGPKIQKDLLITLLNFRLFPRVATSDAKKMYRQVVIDPPDSNFQLILWRENKSDPLKVLRLRTVTYGTAPGQFLSVRTLLQLADDEGHDFPLGAKFLRECFYVDDGLLGAESVEELREGLDQLQSLLARGGFELSKFCSNSEEILRDIPPERQEKCLIINDHSVIKTLGMCWQPDLDVFRFSFTPSESNDCTKRAVLSEIARIFDPLGLICPVVTRAKIFVQLLWQVRPKLDWDTCIPSDLASEWTHFKDDLCAIKDVVVPRFIYDGVHRRHIQIHGFSDASERAYGACVYVRVAHSEGHVSTHLLTAKSRVAPMKTQSIARLELSAAVMLYELMQRLLSEVFHETSIDHVFYWTDSSIVLSWLNAPASTWNIFVAHRVAKIQEESNVFQWCHIPGESNPADLLSRGMNASEIISSQLWWNGPSFLHEKNFVFPDQFVLPGSIEDVEEFRPIRRTLLTRRIVDLTQSMRFSCGYRGICRAFAYMLRFIDGCRKRIKSRTQPATRALASISQVSIPSIEEERLGEEALIRVVQRSHFSAEFDCLEKTQPIPKSSSIRKLDPFLDNATGLLRVGGRLKKAKMPFDSRHQILLPKGHPVTKSLIRYYHTNKLYHAGPMTVLVNIRARYWPVGGLQAARSVVTKCVWCFRMHPKLMSQIMGQLPAERVDFSHMKPFLVTGVDFAGPIRVRHHIRCKQSKEVHLALFVCFVTKAIHVELVPDRSTESFLLALKRMISDRGTVSKMFSDNATNFKGAANYSKELSDSLKADANRIESELRDMQIEWSFIAPRTPHQGGLWEVSIRLLKRVIKNIVGAVELTQDELATVAKQAAAVVNSRPLTPLSADPNDLEPLTPAHFLHGSAPSTFFETSLLNFSDVNKLKLIHRMRFTFQKLWDRFYKEYLSLLQSRNKWYVRSGNVKIGDMVLLQMDNCDPLKWPLGRIVDVKTDAQGDVRNVRVKTSTGEYERGIQRVALLPLSD